jgi:hypothetical protein
MLALRLRHLLRRRLPSRLLRLRQLKLRQLKLRHQRHLPKRHQRMPLAQARQLTQVKRRMRVRHRRNKAVT